MAIIQHCKNHSHFCWLHDLCNANARPDYDHNLALQKPNLFYHVLFGPGKINAWLMHGYFLVEK